jgi:hypothetical protein
MHPDEEPHVQGSRSSPPMRFSRRFESGTKVKLDLRSHSATITWASS